jgi:broad specificity phosphatase PhoE
MVVLFITHPEVIVDPATPVPEWSLSSNGRAKMEAFSASNIVANVKAIWASNETKAREAANVLGARLELPVHNEGGLSENDRSATGYLPPMEFERVADAFFREPDTSTRGWECARDAQERISEAVDRILSLRTGDGDTALISHGAVGTLLLCQYLGVAITRAHDQPSQGHFWCFDAQTRQVIHTWRPLVSR